MKHFFVFVFGLSFVAMLQIFSFYLILGLVFSEHGPGLAKNIFRFPLENLEDLRWTCKGKTLFL